MRPLLHHTLTSHDLPCLLLDTTEALVGISVLSGGLHGVDGLGFVLRAGSLPCLAAGNVADGLLVMCEWVCLGEQGKKD